MSSGRMKPKWGVVTINFLREAAIPLCPVAAMDQLLFQYRQAVSKTPPHLLQQKQRSFLTFGFGAGGSGPTRRESHVNVNVTPTSHDVGSDTPEIRKYKKRFNSDILCAALWGVNLLIGTETGLMLLDRSGQGKVYQLISRRRFQQMEVLEGQNILVTISGKKNRVRVYYLSWLKSKILRTDGQVERRNGWINVGDLQGAVHFKIVKYERIKFLVIALKDSIEIYAWAPKPYHKFMAFKSFGDLAHRPLLVDLTVEEGTRLKVIYGSADGFHAVDLDSASVYDIYLPKHTQGPISPHCIVPLPNSNGMQLLLCYDNEGVYVNTYGKVSKNIVLQWGEMPTSVAYIGTGQIMGWGNKAIEIRSVETGHLDGVFMHKKSQKLKFLCERNDKVGAWSPGVLLVSKEWLLLSDILYDPQQARDGQLVMSSAALPTRLTPVTPPLSSAERIISVCGKTNALQMALQDLAVRWANEESPY
uniref:non-specific serine/threonine protein kinase n=1 Tax=Timema bartmani TaxID=61472 RepID=A0A7R9EV27_9NEOP|nr:unnamed protein product [Timema bartmani]